MSPYRAEVGIEAGAAGSLLCPHTGQRWVLGLWQGESTVSPYRAEVGIEAGAGGVYCVPIQGRGGYWVWGRGSLLCPPIQGRGGY